MLIGSPRFRCQEANESGFRSYLREHVPNCRVIEPLITYESKAIAHELTEKLLVTHPDLHGLYISGGGITGAIAALQDRQLTTANLKIVGYELIPVTRKALVDGTLTAVIAHPIRELCHQVIVTMTQLAHKTSFGKTDHHYYLDFFIHTRENL